MTKKSKIILAVVGIIIVLGAIGGGIYYGTSGNTIVQDDSSSCIKGTGKSVRQSIDVGSFTGISVGGPASILRVNQDGNNIFEIEAEQNIIDELETSVDENGVLQIGYSRCVNDSGLKSIFG
ncbi:hypothetical protein ACFL2D_02895, partial [Patescibacteria group bacterium]